MTGVSEEASEAQRLEREAVLERDARAQVSCLLCMGAKPERRRAVRMAKPRESDERSAALANDEWSVVELPLYLCERCDRKTRVLDISPKLWFIALPALLAALLFLGFFVVTLFRPGLSAPHWMIWALPVAGAQFALLGAAAWANQRRRRRLAKAHPLGRTLLAEGYRPTSKNLRELGQGPDTQRDAEHALERQELPRATVLRPK